MKTAEQHQARALRALGWSITEIEQHLGVARSSVSYWVRHVQLSDEARQRLIARTRLGPVVAAELKAARARELRRQYQDDGRRFARERGFEYATGCMLYWAEGAKARNTVELTNSDIDLVTVFCEFLRREFDVPDSRFRVRLNLFADHIERVREVEEVWLNRLRLPRTCLRKPQVNVYSKYSQKKRTNKLPYGTCDLILHSSQIVQTIYGSIQEYGGFERPEWLD